ncbi:MAG: hypothetical protein ACFFDP_06795 [Promethearchaeota archaeon]
MKKGTLTWKWVVVIIAILIIDIGYLGVSFLLREQWLWGCRPYPGEFTYSEYRYTDTPEEAAALQIAETFNYTQIPADTSHLWSSAGFISQARREALNTTANEFDPYAHCGYQHYTYTATVNLVSNLTIVISAWEPYPVYNPLHIESNGTILFPLNLLEGPVYSWLGGYLNNTHYVSFDKAQSFNYTNVYLIEMRLSYSYGFGMLSAGDELECQHIIVDTTGKVLFASWILFLGPIA